MTDLYVNMSTGEPVEELRGRRGPVVRPNADDRKRLRALTRTTRAWEKSAEVRERQIAELVQSGLPLRPIAVAAHLSPAGVDKIARRVTNRAPRLHAGTNDDLDVELLEESSCPGS